MNRVKEIQDKEKAPKIDVSASKRIVKSALWQAAQNQQQTAGNLYRMLIYYLVRALA
jgi:exosome complex protein LRP1